MNVIHFHFGAGRKTRLSAQFLHFLDQFYHLLDQFRELFLLLEGEDALLDVVYLSANGVHLLVTLRLVNELALLLHVLLEVVQNLLGVSYELMLSEELERKESLDE